MSVAARGRFGLVGLGVMGRNLALNMADHGVTVALFNRRPEVAAQMVAEHPQAALEACLTMEDLVASLPRPRRVLLMVPAGDPVDQMIGQLAPLLDQGDVILDGGNSWYEHTQRRERELRERGLRFFGMGVSGGEEGARYGPSLMPGGDAAGWLELQPVLEAIAAKTEAGPCVTHVGTDGAGHFVKMVHNGIEYADMQLIAEAYDLLERVGGMDAPALADTFATWNEGPLESFLIEITAQIFRVRDPDTNTPLVEQVLDRAGQKGTGMWTARVALDRGIPVPSIAAAVNARVLSSMKPARVAAATRYPVPAAVPAPDPETLTRQVHDGLLAAKVCAYAQGLHLIAATSDHHGWHVDLAEMARIWKGGCIIRARLLDTIRAAFEGGAVQHLLEADAVRDLLVQTEGALRATVTTAAQHGIPAPALSASLAWYDSYRTADLPQNLTQAQRDAFGAHTYWRKDDPDGEARHTDWLD